MAATEELRAKWVKSLADAVRSLFAHHGDVRVESESALPTGGRAAVTIRFGPRSDGDGWGGGEAPQVVFDVVSADDSYSAWLEREDYYSDRGVEEYFVLVPERNKVRVERRAGAMGLQVMANGETSASPRLGVRFDREGGKWRIVHPDGRPFVTFE